MNEINKFQKDGAICALVHIWFLWINACAWLFYPYDQIVDGNYKMAAFIFLIGVSGFLYFLRRKAIIDLGD